MVKNIKNRLKNEKGLTLVELLAVIVILGIIAAIAVPAIGGIIQKSNEDAVKSEAITVINAAKLYVAAEGLPEGDEKDLKVEGEDAELIPYLDEINDETKKLTVTVKVDEKSDVVYTISSSSGLKAGSKSITFDDATINDINAHDTKKNNEGNVKVE